ncbi:MAG: DNA polymerase I, partial [Anaerolineae bacterium]
MSKKKLVLIDGHALAYRAFHALPSNLATSRGELTNAVYGFTSMLLNVLRDEKPDYIAVAFDVGKSFRHDEYAAYKAQRAKTPDELIGQVDRIKDIVRAFNIPIFEVEGYEADDVLGTLAKQASQKGVETLIVTGDTDAFQLIGPHVKVLTSRRQFSDTVIYDEEGIRQRYGLEPQQLVDFKGLKGDVSDNIPGVPGIGDKTATALLQRFGTVEEAIAHLDEIPNKRARKALEAHKEEALLSKRLATITTDVPLTLDLETCRASDYDRARVMALFRELEFKSLFDRLPRETSISQGLPESRRPSAQLPMFKEEVAVGPRVEAGNYHTIHTDPTLGELAARLAQVPKFALDVETTSQDAMLADLVGIAIAPREGEAYYIPVGHEQGRQLPLHRVLERLSPALQDPSIEKVTHNGKYDLTVLIRHGAQVQGPLFDTMVAAWLLEPSRRGFGLKELAWARLGAEMRPITDLIGKGKQQITMAQVPIASAAQYAGADVDMTYRLAQLLEKELRDKALWDLFEGVEMPLVPILAEMEMSGVALDVGFLQELSRELYQRITALEREIQEMVGYPFNVGSTQQLSDALFIKLGLSAQGIPKTKSGHYSTSAGVLEKLRGQHPVIELILEHRQLSKLKSTYVDALPSLIHPETGRVHTSYNQTGTVTGRLSSSSPNLQNIPIRTEEGRRIRRAFIAQEGWQLLAADYSQVELRILAHISGDEGLLAAFHRGEDIHASTAATILGVPLSEVTPDMRRLAKTINFGLSYGMSGYGLAQRTGLSQEEANRFIGSYFANYPGVKAYMERTKREATQQGYVETLLHRRRYFPELQTRDRAHAALRRAAEREAINMPIQGSSADIIKLAMIRLHRALKEEGLASRMILQVHDELVLEVPEAELEIVAPLVRQAMEGAFQLAIPLKVDLKVGRNWEEM